MNKKKSSIKGLLKTNKRIIVFIIIILTIFIAIPFIINYAYLEGQKVKEPNTAFSASDLLSLYGSILSVVTTIVALITTIRFTVYHSKQEQEYQRKTLLADYKKAELLKKYNEIVQYAEKIKNLYLLENLNDAVSGLARLFKQDGIELFVDNYRNLKYWKMKLNLSDSEKEKEFKNVIDDFTYNIDKQMETAAKELNKILKYKKEYKEKKQQFENKKRTFLEKNPNYDLLTVCAVFPGENDKTPSKPPPYGEFKMKEPEDESNIITHLIDSLKKYRDEHKDKFIIVFNELSEYKNKILSNEITKLYDFDKYKQ